MQRLKTGIKQAWFSAVAHPFRRATAPWRLVPQVICVGVQKGGTTSLEKYLCAHPQFVPARLKEIHFFDLDYARGLAFYQAHFDLAWCNNRGKITADFSPYYMVHPGAPGRIALHYPKVKLLFLLRDPVERAYSHYRYMVQLGKEPLNSFGEALRQEPTRIEGEQVRLLAEPYYVSSTYRDFTYKTRGLYLEQIKRWEAYFPREQMLIVRSEDFFENTQAVFNDILDFVGLPHHELPDVRAKNTTQNKGSMLPADREYLREFFRPYNEALYQYLGRDFGWQ